MKNLKQIMMIISLMLITCSFTFAQQQPRQQRPPVTGQQTTPAVQRQRAPEDSTIRMTHFQTEIWDPEI